MAEPQDDLADARKEIARLEQENALLQRAVDKAARALRGDLYASSLNEAIHALNRVLPSERRILEVCFGTVSLGALQQAVKNLWCLVGVEGSAFPVKHIDYTDPAPVRRQRPGGFPV